MLALNVRIIVIGQMGNQNGSHGTVQRSESANEVEVTVHRSKSTNEVRVAGLFSIYSDPECLDIDIASVQALESVFWIFEHLNTHQYIPGVKLVLQPYKTCCSPQMSSLQTARIVSEIDDKVLMGVIGPVTSAETNISSEFLSSLPARYRLPQVVYQPTSSLFTNKDTYSNLLRVVPSDNTQVKTIIALLKRLDWNYISVIREDDMYAMNATDHLKTLAKSEHISRDISEFALHWEKIASNETFLMERAITNPWLNKEAVLGTDQSIYVQYSIKTAYVMAMALRSLHTSMCGESFNGACSDFVNSDRNSLIDIMSNLTVNFTDFPFTISSFVKDDLTIKFDRFGEIQLVSAHVPMYEVYRYKECDGTTTEALCKVKIADYTNDTFSINESLHNLRGYGQCSGSCLECMSEDLPSEIINKPGDLIVVGLMPMHDQGQGSPLTCGDIRPSIGLDITLAIQYVVESVNNATDMFPDKTIGYTIMDTCNDPLVTQKRILDMLSTDGEYRNKILGVIGPLGSTATISAAGIFSSLGIVQVGCCSSAQILSNTNMYPTFLRVSTSIYKQAELMVKLAKKIGTNYIQIVYSKGEFGASGRDAILLLAQEYSICVVENSLPVGEDSNGYDVLPHIRKYPDARVVMLFLRSHKASVVAEALNTFLKDDGFIFIASDSWGKREDNILGRPGLRGMITISQEMGYDFGYEDYLMSINVTEARYDNSFLERFAEARLGCYFESSFNRYGKPKCVDDHMIQPGTLDPWHSFVLNAVYALLKGGDNALKERPMFANDIDAEFLLDHVRKVPQKYGAPARSQTYMFDKTGDGTVGFHIYNVHINQTSNQPMYVKVGQWLDDLLLFNDTMLDDKTQTLDSQCKTQEGYCAKCFQGNDDRLYV
ncbi:metabotropic glutamate receptor-like [Pecten maximus]|uniref:metabotropic glutamate receptor-like n=1 Tax=Pecten maximus TaxID=6579 RepID=UPI001458923A|nr:metabotropic glutamate receptor-like [Pecten maximus]